MVSELREHLVGMGIDVEMQVQLRQPRKVNLGSRLMWEMPELGSRAKAAAPAPVGRGGEEMWEGNLVISHYVFS